MKITVYTMNVFSKKENGGNQAGVVINSDSLSVNEMQSIAAKVGFSETAFIQRSQVADYKIKFFTPFAEVDLCGHATIAAFKLLASKNIISVGKYTQETKAGNLKVEYHQDGNIYMHQAKPAFYQEIDKKEIADSLNVNEKVFMKDLPAQIVSTGLRDIIVPVNTLNELLEIKPDFNKITSISKKYDVVGYHLFSLNTVNFSTAHCRNFAPLYDIPEEAATGTSNGALSCYLYKHGIINEAASKNMIYEQGYSMEKPSEIYASLIISKNEIVDVLVGGTADFTNEIEVFI